MGGGRPMLVCYVAGFEKADDAKKAVTDFVGGSDGNEVRDPAPLTENTVKALGVKPKDVWML